MSLTLTIHPELADALDDLAEQYGIEIVSAAVREMQEEIDDEDPPSAA